MKFIFTEHKWEDIVAAQKALDRMPQHKGFRVPITKFGEEMIEKVCRAYGWENPLKKSKSRTLKSKR